MYFRKFLYLFKQAPVTYTTIMVCILVFLIHNFSGQPIVYLLAYYKPFILAGEYWRMITSGLCHTQVWHIFMNLYGMYIYGNIMEPMFGSKRFFILLFGSVLGGSLFLFFSADSNLAIGLSGGLYGLMATMIYIYIRTKLIDSPQIRANLTRLLLINIMINFAPNIAFLAHLGGFVSGFLLANAIDQSQNRSLAINSAIACVILFVVLGYIGFQKKDVGSEHQYQLDVGILRYESQLGFDNHAKNVASELDEIYHTSIVSNSIQ